MHALPQLHGKNCDCTSTLSYWGFSKAWNKWCFSDTRGHSYMQRLETDEVQRAQDVCCTSTSFADLPEILPGSHRCYSFRSSSLISQTSIVHYYTLNWELRFSLPIFFGGGNIRNEYISELNDNPFQGGKKGRINNDNNRKWHFESDPPV